MSARTPIADHDDLKDQVVRAARRLDSIVASDDHLMGDFGDASKALSDLHDSVVRLDATLGWTEDVPLTWQDWVARTNETGEDANLLLEWMRVALMDARTLARALDLIGIPAPQATTLPPR